LNKSDVLLSGIRDASEQCFHCIVSIHAASVACSGRQTAGTAAAAEEYHHRERTTVTLLAATTTTAAQQFSV